MHIRLPLRTPKIQVHNKKPINCISSRYVGALVLVIIITSIDLHPILIPVAGSPTIPKTFSLSYMRVSCVCELFGSLRVCCVCPGNFSLCLCGPLFSCLAVRLFALSYILISASADHRDSIEQVVWPRLRDQLYLHNRTARRKSRGVGSHW